MESIREAKSREAETYLEKGNGAEMAAKGDNFSRLEKMAKNRVRWKHIVDGLCSTPE